MSVSPTLAAVSPLSPNSVHNRRTPGTDALSTKSQSPTGTASSAGSKRKRDAEPKLYAVRVGHSPGVYFSWSDCLAQVKGFKNATFKSFTTITDAEAFVAGKDLTLDPNSTSYTPQKFYAVRNGRVPGIYTDWPSAQKQIKGWTKPKHRSFTTRAEAEKFMKEDQSSGLTNENEQAKTTAKAEPDSSYADDDSSLQPLDGAAAYAQDPNGSPKKKTKTSNKTSNDNAVAPPLHAAEEDELYDPGTGPLPPSAEDGFDHRIILNPATGEVEVKSEAQMQKQIFQPQGLESGSVLRIFTDGSSLGNGYGGATAGVGVYFGPNDVRNISEPLTGSRQTNNRAELTAIQRALDIAPRNQEVCIYTDSSYSINCVTSWCKNWRKNNWTSANGKAVENRDLIETILETVELRNDIGAATNFQWLRGHANNEGNVQADRLAVEGARKARL
ncbi:MAG: hypothetical protein M1816_001287 [Peltula sp. TS41687]|nr:MAG: hypothetical protein M1816_001287 [Peltula sp. TS41687]